MAELETKLENFECQRCNECCRQPGFVYLEAGEAERITDHLKFDLYTFTDRFCEVEERRRLVLKKHADEACVFLTAEGCSIYAIKPRQCLDFPVKWRTPRSLEYCAGLKKLAAQP